MDYVTFGRTGIQVSVAGLGCGGPSRLGQAQGASAATSRRLVEHAVEIGINYFDTSELYGTEEIVGTALARKRDAVVVSTKSPVSAPGRPRHDAASLRRAIVGSLARLHTDRVDVFHLHGVRLSDYSYCLTELVPVLEQAREEGLVRFLALSEAFSVDVEHRMLSRAVTDKCWDVAMVGFNLLNPTAKDEVLPLAQRRSLGIEVMYAVRKAMSQPHVLAAIVTEGIEQGLVNAERVVDPEHPLDFLLQGGAARTVVEAAYRYARHQSGGHVVLTGTGNVAHLEENVRAINLGPLPDDALQGISGIFGGLRPLNGD